MSAFIVGHDHIDALLTFAQTKRYSSNVSYYFNGNRIEINSKNATEVGRILLTENERSVRYRYSSYHPDDLPGGQDERADSYNFREWDGRLTPLSVLKGCDCFDYQACESDDYEASLACRIVDAIRHRAISSLPGWDEAVGWEFRRPATVAA